MGFVLAPLIAAALCFTGAFVTIVFFPLRVPILLTASGAVFFGVALVVYALVPRKRTAAEPGLKSFGIVVLAMAVAATLQVLLPVSAFLHAVSALLERH